MRVYPDSQPLGWHAAMPRLSCPGLKPAEDVTGPEVVSSRHTPPWGHYYWARLIVLESVFRRFNSLIGSSRWDLAFQVVPHRPDRFSRCTSVHSHVSSRSSPIPNLGYVHRPGFFFLVACEEAGSTGRFFLLLSLPAQYSVAKMGQHSKFLVPYHIRSNQERL